MATNEFLIRKAVELAKAGQKEGARAILIALYPKETDNIRYWAAFALASNTRAEAMESLEQILKIQPRNQWAWNQLLRLREQQSLMRQAADNRAMWSRVISLHTASYAGLIAAIIVTAGLVLFGGGGGGTPVVADNEPLANTPMPAAPTVDVSTMLAGEDEGGSFAVQPPEESTPTLIPSSTPKPAATSTAQPGETAGAAAASATTAAPTLTPTLALTATATTTAAPTVTPTPTEEPIPTIPPDIDVATNMPEPVSGPCDCYMVKLTCTDFSSQSDAQACYDYCLENTGMDIHGLDRNLNQVACDEP